MNDPLNWDLLARYLAGECLGREAAEVDEWLAADPEHSALLDDLREAWAVAAEPDVEWDTAAALERVWALNSEASGESDADWHPERDAEGTGRIAKTRRWKHAGSWFHPAYWGAAAAIAGLSVVGALGIRAVLDARPEPSVVMQELTTEKGERARFRLADGTKVIVGPESRLEVPAQFATDAREVQLWGEAFFDVTSDPKRPFLVRAEGVLTRVVGTQFNIRAYPRDEQVQVVVAEGEVVVTPQGSETGAVLRRGELAEASAGQRGDIEVRAADLERQVGWVRGDLNFDDTPLSVVCVELERWYDVPIRVSDLVLGAEPLTASFRDQPLDEVLEVIAATLNATYSRSGRTILFQPKQSHLVTSR